MPSVDMSNFEFNFGAAIKGTLLALVLSLLLSAGAGLIYHFTSLAESTVTWSAGIILLASTFCGAFYAGKQAGCKGLYHGVAVGIVFCIFVLIAAWLFFPGQAGIGIIAKLLITALGGALGGIVGVGLAEK